MSTSVWPMKNAATTMKMMRTSSAAASPPMTLPMIARLHRGLVQKLYQSVPGYTVASRRVGSRGDFIMHNVAACTSRTIVTLFPQRRDG